jgi:hypothetical protein
VLTQPVLQLLHVVGGDCVQLLGTHRSHQVQIQDRSLGRDAARLLTIRNSVVVDESRHERFRVARARPWLCTRRDRLACRPAYTPRDPTASVLYTVVRENVETFRVEGSSANVSSAARCTVEPMWLYRLACSHAMRQRCAADFDYDGSRSTGRVVGARE